MTGEDAESFLQGQFSQELRPARVGPINYGFWLTRQGKVFGDAVIVRESDDVWRIFSGSLSATALVERLESFIIADDVTVADETARWQAWRIAGGDVAAWLPNWRSETAAAGGTAWGWEEAQPLPGGSALIVASQPPPWPKNWPEATTEEFEQARIAAGIPRVPQDLGEGDLPQEAGLDAVGVSFNKGCYLGQEVMARLQSLGRVRRRLVTVAGAGDVPGVEQVDLWQGEKRVGALRSRVAGFDGAWLGLALVSVASCDFTRPVGLVQGDGDAPAIDIVAEVTPEDAV
ncbi:hypothetical protein LZG03_09265 [Opitutaceae bacterium LMO-CP1]|uniref:CAF17-like 4Fe-4S cluster assembly/insertion protein YgfZ n=1 Tax=Synoicihabitans lomoniglobus TaxID=2909285 RepID=UPI00304EFDA5|nr:hypothetical protein [Opitutaceae bacterium LMO-M01]